MKTNDYKLQEVKFRDFYGRYSQEISSEGRESTEHYLNVAEIEMACESFVLSLMEDEVALSIEDKSVLLSLVKNFNLDKESVFRADFWTVARDFLGSKPGAG